MRCSSRVTVSGDLQLLLQVNRRDLEILARIIDELGAEIRIALRIQEAAERARIQDELDSQARLEAFEIQARLALSVFRRSGSIRLASMASGILATDIRMIVREASKRQRACRTAARHELVGRMYAAGIPPQIIAKRARVHVKSVPRIARAVRQPSLPGLGRVQVAGTR